MSRLSIVTKNRSQETVEELYKDAERRIQASQPGLCPVDLAKSFLHICHSQSCGKCTPCRVGLGQLEELMEQVLSGTASLETLDVIERTAESIFASADCAIGQEAARMVLKGVKGFRDDYEEHIVHGRCLGLQNQPVPCVALCPAHVDIPGYISLIYEGRYADAVRLIRKDNPLPATCGLICEHPCEVRCRRTMVDDPINIRGLKRFAVEHEGEIPAPECAPATGKRVAVIGGGPSGLSAAYYLSLMGHEVTVFEQRKKLGGMLRYGIPSYRLPREALDHEIEGMKKAGFKTVCGVSIGTDILLEDLRREYDAIYIAIGAHTDRKIGIEGEDAKGVISAVEMLRAIGDDQYPDYSGKRVVVVGGGNVAMDVARSAIRLGAESVQVAYRRRKADMTALPEEVEGAVADGCEILELHAPTRIEKDEAGAVAAIWVKPQIVGPIKWGRPAPVNSVQEEKRIPCDLVLVAVGQGIDSQKFGDYGIPVKRGNISAQESGQIENMDGIFSGGDCVTGPATVIRAIAGGKVAAANIDEYLGFHHEIESQVEIPRIRFDDHEPMGRVNMTERPAQERRCDFKLMEHCMSEEEAHQESSRCLHCDHFGYGIFKGGREAKW
ncbi:MAG: FAD-dependent oxidoreductase [Oscillospiraceae bacterium]|nr:FAD-dependent oxidoreductase [Oscillospiraceae bacterium]